MMNLQQLQWDELKENLKEIIQNNPKASSAFVLIGMPKIDM